ncbi:MAG: site-specific integrase [Bacillota bacterium]
MNVVEPIRDKKDINKMKKALGNPRDRLLFIFGINSALRISDILKLKVSDVRSKASISLREQKTDKNKRLPFNDKCLKAINELVPKDADPNDYLFKSQKGDNKPLSRIQAYRILNDAAKRAGINEPISCHSLRKTFGYHAYKNGTDLPFLMTVFNHSSQSVTLRYIGITQENIDSVYHNVNL